MRRICGTGYWRQRGGNGEVAERFGVSQAYVSRVRSRHQRLGQASAGAQHNHVPLRLGGLKEPLLAQVASAPEQTLAQLCQWVKAEHGIEVGPTTMGKTLARLGLTRKKRRCMPASSSEATSPRRARPGAPRRLRWRSGG
jgi:transposase